MPAVLLISVITGSLLVLGSVVLLGLRIIKLNAQANQDHDQFRISFGKLFSLDLKTNYPILIMFAIGAVLIGWTTWLENNRHLNDTACAQIISKKISLKLKRPSRYAGYLSAYALVGESIGINNEAILEVPLRKCRYKIIYYDGKSLFDDEWIAVTGDVNETEYELKGPNVRPQENEPIGELATSRRETPNVVNRYKDEEEAK
jgi:hypothetical protein